MKVAKNHYGIEHVITATNFDNESNIEKMVKDAMCAYMDQEEVLEHPYLASCNDVVAAKARYNAQFETIIRCIGLFVEQPASCIRNYIIARCDDEYGTIA